MGITIERQLPERGQRAMAAAPAGQCCCCCCCCLHSVGGVVGALSARPSLPDAAPSHLPVATVAGPPLEPRYSATKLYWSTIAIVSALVGVFFLVERRHVEAFDVALIVGICFPAIQLAASVVAGIVVGLSRRAGKDARLHHLGKITVRAFLGAVIGALIMVPMLRGC